MQEVENDPDFAFTALGNVLRDPEGAPDSLAEYAGVSRECAIAAILYGVETALAAMDGAGVVVIVAE
jgi:hypothetical protein